MGSALCRGGGFDPWSDNCEEYDQRENGESE